MAILNDTATRLRAIGVYCLVSPMSLPQGMSVSLHAGATAEAATAADVAAERGGEYAGAVDTHKQFAQMVELAIADAAEMIELANTDHQGVKPTLADLGYPPEQISLLEVAVTTEAQMLARVKLLSDEMDANDEENRAMQSEITSIYAKIDAPKIAKT